jgi:hypothetical protein
MDLRKKPDSVGVFMGLITTEGKVRYQARIESSSPITGISYKEGFELPGGRAKEKDLRKLLTLKGLINEGVREVREELGLAVSLPLQEFPLYWAPYENPQTDKVDWAFMIPVLPRFWDEAAQVKRRKVDLDPKHLDALGDLDLIVSGKKRMYRMGQGALYACSSNALWRKEAADLLGQAKPDWREIEYHEQSERFLKQLRKALSLE